MHKACCVSIVWYEAIIVRLFYRICVASVYYTYKASDLQFYRIHVQLYDLCASFSASPIRSFGRKYAGDLLEFHAPRWCLERENRYCCWSALRYQLRRGHRLVQFQLLNWIQRQAPTASILNYPGWSPSPSIIHPNIHHFMGSRPLVLAE